VPDLVYGLSQGEKPSLAPGLYGILDELTSETEYDRLPQLIKRSE
jgi:hypothetical protein